MMARLPKGVGEKIWSVAIEEVWMPTVETFRTFVTSKPSTSMVDTAGKSAQLARELRLPALGT